MDSLNRRLERRVLSAAAGAPGPGSAALRAVLGPVSNLYGHVAKVRGDATDPRPLPAPAVSVGNVTAGGTGKTPVVRWLARKLSNNGRQVAILTRGYRGGDEARELAADLAAEKVEVIVNPDRVAGAASAPAGINAFVMDDGFQHRRAARAFDLVLVDATNPLGHGRPLPAGLLREPAAALARAGAVLVTRCDLVPDPAAVAAAVGRLTDAPVFTSRHVIGDLTDPAGAAHEPATYAAFCGLGNPAGFFDALARRLPDARCLGTLAFPDHHAYRPGDLAPLRSLGADRLITTGKDLVKLDAPDGVLKANLTIDIDGEDELFDRITAALRTE